MRTLEKEVLYNNVSNLAITRSGLQVIAFTERKQIMKLTGKLKKKVSEAKTKEEAKLIIKDTIPDIWLSKVLPFSVSEYSSAVSNSS